MAYDQHNATVEYMYICISAGNGAGAIYNAKSGDKANSVFFIHLSTICY